ncbi:hypothetical protein TGAM01_v203759 [Trichoderma gamsii]|uniref:Uncharacterized protein n=1 Tax=Trichoderma gamsii TaxID=398673 RepID=A0A2P4ZSX4_9HYPO|nr:hypothetical protein TGAM01_v203759 [Trichoderma gamsii]PON27378.1 hypothetical protein TGAM01_v203759 [Trichoderma gamsii]
MHLFELLPSVIALATPAFAKGGFGDFTTQAVLYTERSMQGDNLGIRASHIDRCVTLDDIVYRNVGSKEAFRIPASFGFSALVARCTLYSTDGCGDSLDIGTLATTDALDSTDVAAISYTLNVDDGK